jgi:hypothetical protein
MKPSRHLVAGALVLAALGGASVLLSRTASADEVRIVVAPPAARIEVKGPRPGPYHVWQSGSWVWGAEGRYVWHPGRWVEPPHGKTVWVRDEWVSYGGAWHFVPGHWRTVGEHVPPASQRALVATQPPAEVVETVGAAPVGHAWIHGHWAWDGGAYAWVPGHFMAVPDGYRTWEPGRWYASNGHWFYHNGYWR